MLRRPTVRPATALATLTALLLTGLTAAGCQSGISKDEHCSSQRAMIDTVSATVSATRSSPGITVSWRDTYAVREALTYRVYRRSSAAAPWSRIAELTLDPTAPREHKDHSHPSTAPYYAVTSIGECGETPICAQVNVGEQCSVASVEPAAKQS